MQTIFEDNELKTYLREMYYKKYGNVEQFEKNYELYKQVPIFKANENIYEITTNYKDRDNLNDKEGAYLNYEGELKGEVHWLIRCATQYYLIKAFEAMKIDLSDPNIRENALGKGTPGRIAKMWCGNDPYDTSELGSGRWNKEPYISTFPKEGNLGIVTKEVDLVSNCSHHFLPFSSLDGGKVIVSYKPDKYVLGISKLQRFVNWASKRFWLQEDLTNYIGKTIERIADTKDVYIKLEGIVHGCEKFRGANAKNGSLTTEYKNGIFKEGE